MSDLYVHLASLLKQPGGREKLAKYLRSLPPQEQRLLWSILWSRIEARDNQKPPEWAWQVWLILAGRGWGKTRTGAEQVQSWAESGLHRRIALVGPTAADVRDVMVEGETGILKVSEFRMRPVYEPSKRRLTWPNGVIATTFSAEDADQLRGPQHHKAWCDEIASWKYPETWDMLMFGLRLGQSPQVVATTTPKPIRVISDLMKDEGKTVHVTRGNTYENQRNLAQSFIDKIVSKYEGTRLGRQELYAEVLDDVPGALWTLAMIEAAYVHDRPEMERIVVAIDPAVTSTETSDECGIVVAGRAMKDKVPHGYVLADYSCKASPTEWARKAVAAYHEYKADRIVAEVNNGGDLVELTLRMVDGGRDVPFTKVHASRGKRIRAEPVSALYEQGRMHHVGRFPQLEDQMRLFNPETYEGSPDRLDAMVWSFTNLIVEEQEPGVFVL